MSVPTWSQTVDNMFTTTWSNRKSTVVEQAYLKTPFIAWLKKQGKIDSGMSGYTRIEIPVEYGSNDTVRWIGKGSTMPLTEGELVTMCYENWKYVAVSILRFGTEDQQNKGKARLINYAERKINAAERAINEEFERVFQAAASAADEPNSIQSLIATAPTTGSIHGLDRSAYAWWRNQTKQATGAFSVYGISDMRNILNTISKYANSEISGQFMMTDQTTYEAYEDELLDYLRISDKSMTDLGFENLKFKGRPIFWTPSAPAAQIRFINPAFTKLMIDASYYMEMTNWKEIPDQVNDRTAQIVCALNLVCSRPIVNGVLHTITY